MVRKRTANPTPSPNWQATHRFVAEARRLDRMLAETVKAVFLLRLDEETTHGHRTEAQADLLARMTTDLQRCFRQFDQFDGGRLARHFEGLK